MDLIFLVTAGGGKRGNTRNIDKMTKPLPHRHGHSSNVTCQPVNPNQLWYNKITSYPPMSYPYLLRGGLGEPVNPILDPIC